MGSCRYYLTGVLAGEPATVAYLVTRGMVVMLTVGCLADRGVVVCLSTCPSAVFASGQSIETSPHLQRHIYTATPYHHQVNGGCYGIILEV